MPFVKRLDVPTIGAILMRTTEVSSAQQASDVARDADLCLRPPIDDFGVLEFGRINEIVEAGFRYAQQTLLQLRGNPSAAVILPPPVLGGKAEIQGAANGASAHPIA